MITVGRSPERLPGLYFRPISHTPSQRKTLTFIRREVGEGRPDKVIQRELTSEIDVNDAWFMIKTGYSEARIEDQYNRGKYIGGFVFAHILGAFIHEDELDWAEQMGDRIGPGAVIAKRARLDDDAKIGPFTELEQGVRIGKGVVLGPDTVVRKGSVIQDGTEVGGHTYFGRFSVVGQGVKVGVHSVMGNRLRVGDGTEIGTQNQYGNNVFIGDRDFIGDSVRFGRDSFVADDVTVGEMTVTGHHLHIGQGSLVGAESVFGSFVRVTKNSWLRSPTYAKDGEILGGLGINGGGFNIGPPETDNGEN